MHAISTGSFDYVKEFPNSKKGHRFSNTPCANETVEEAAIEWLKIKKSEVVPSTYKSYRSKFKCHIIPKFGKKRLDSIIKSDIKKWMATDLYHLENKTINNLMIPFKGLFSDAIDDGKLSKSPFQTIKPFKEKKPKPDPFLQSEIAAIVNTAINKPQEVNAFEFACWAGLRPSEMIMVAWEDLDMVNWQLTVNRAKVDNVIKQTKTDESKRVIDLLEPAIDAIKRQMEFSKLLPPIEIKVLDQDKKSYFNESVRFVFLNSLSSEPYPDTSYFRRHFFKPHLSKAGVRDRGIKQARRTFASQLLTLGVNIRWIADQMGHTTIKMIEQHYGKWIKSERPDMAKSISNMLDYDSKRSNSDPMINEKVINPL